VAPSFTNPATEGRTFGRMMLKLRLQRMPFSAQYNSIRMAWTRLVSAEGDHTGITF